jgi:hypothetical protein
MGDRHDGLIEGFIREPDVAKSHEILIDAPAEVVLDVAEHFDLQSIPTIHFLFRLREFLFLIRPKPRPQVKALVSETMKLGWVRLAHVPGRELVMGAIAQPWVGKVQFKSVEPDAFARFAEPGFVKIVWTLEVEPLQRRSTLFRTQTRVLATDAAARKRFLLYWFFAGPLVTLIRILGIRAVRREAERRLI